MYLRLKSELVLKKKTMSELAEFLNMRLGTLSEKINGKNKRFDFTLDEAMKIRKFLGTDMSLDELFEEEV